MTTTKRTLHTLDIWEISEEFRLGRIIDESHRRECERLAIEYGMTGSERQLLLDFCGL